MKNICILRASPRRYGNTNTLTDLVSACWQEAGCSVTEFDLYNMDIRPCTACRACQKDWSTTACAQQDDLQRVFPAVLESDLILLATPIYSWYCTPPMKAALDRLVYAMNKYYGDEKGPSLWKGRSVAMVVTCGYRPQQGADLLEEGIRRYCRHSGLQYAGMLCERHLGYRTEFMDDEKRLHAQAFAQRFL